jgi:putative ABC transport system ATP-binding protein
MISVKGLSKEFVDGEVVTHALRDVTFEIKNGEFVAVMGPSGSGKSTLLNILSFLERPSGGAYTFNGKSIGELSDLELAHVRNKEMGYVFQSFNLLARSTVFENVEMPLLYAAYVHIKDRADMVRKAIDAVGLTDKTDTEAGKLSGGQKQRVAIARALVNDPHVIFADEPTGNLDSASGAQIMKILNGLHHAGRTVILVTHETFTSEYAHRLIRLKDGRVESDAPIANHRNGKKGFLK